MKMTANLMQKGEILMSLTFLKVSATIPYLFPNEDALKYIHITLWR